MLLPAAGRVMDTVTIALRPAVTEVGGIMIVVSTAAGIASKSQLSN